jgi:hypothetical protein
MASMSRRLRRNFYRDGKGLQHWPYRGTRIARKWIAKRVTLAAALAKAEATQ